MSMVRALEQETARSKQQSAGQPLGKVGQKAFRVQAQSVCPLLLLVSPRRPVHKGLKLALVKLRPWALLSNDVVGLLERGRLPICHQCCADEHIGPTCVNNQQISAFGHRATDSTLALNVSPRHIAFCVKLYLLMLSMRHCKRDLCHTRCQGQCKATAPWPCAQCTYTPSPRLRCASAHCTPCSIASAVGAYVSHLLTREYSQ